MVVFLIIASIILVLVLTVIGGVGALPLIVGVGVVGAMLVIAVRAIIRRFSGRPPLRD